jgi:1-phosphatidylinositol phosphodiesterase
MFCLSYIFLAVCIIEHTNAACSAWNSSVWMESVKGHLFISQIAIPGTHNSAAMYGGIWPECQDETVSSQLEMGIRFLDIRAKYIFYDRDLHIYHGIFKQYALLTSVLLEVDRFLLAFPTETVIVSIRDEGHRHNSPRFLKRVNEILDAWKHRFWLHNWLPTLDDVRGKMVLFNRYDATLGLKTNGWSDCTFTRYTGHYWLKVQDCYSVSAVWDVHWKWDKTREHLEQSLQDGMNKNTLYIHFASCSGGIVPRTCAMFLNWRVADFVRHHNYGSERVGIILFDFPSKDMILSVYNNNNTC